MDAMASVSQHRRTLNQAAASLSSSSGKERGPFRSTSTQNRSSSNSPGPHSMMNMSSLIGKDDLHAQILNYLVVEGYESTAKRFAQEAGIDIMNSGYDLAPVGSEVQRGSASGSGPGPSESDMSDANMGSPLTILFSEIRQRQEIKSLVQNGMVERAIEKINDVDPELLDIDTGLHFSLLRLQLIELIRQSRLNGNIQPALEFASSQLAARAASETKFLVDLEKTMALLCFPSESLVPQLKELLDVKMRRLIADQVNEALLARSGTNGKANIIYILRLMLFSQQRLSDRHSSFKPLSMKDILG